MEEEIIQDQLEVINDVLTTAFKYNLTAEVILSALKYMKEDNSFSIIQALNYGLDEWVK